MIHQNLVFWFGIQNSFWRLIAKRKTDGVDLKSNGRGVIIIWKSLEAIWLEAMTRVNIRTEGHVPAQAYTYEAFFASDGRSKNKPFGLEYSKPK